MHACTRTHTHTHAHAHTRTRTHTHAHTYAHSHARAHTHTHTEACKLQPSVIEVVQKNKAMMVRKVARRHSEAPLHG